MALVTLAASDASVDGDDPGPAPSSPGRARRRGWVLVGLLVAGLGLRLVALDASPLGFHPARQYRSAIIARSFHLEATRPADDPERVVAAQGAREVGDLEPPVQERLVAMVYRLTGEQPWAPRLLGIAAWLAGAAAVWSILGRLRGPTAQIVGTATFLVLPMGVAASRAFQPDALMVGLGLGSMAFALRAGDRAAGSVRPWLPALALGAAAVFVKPMVGPMVLAWCAAVLVTGRGVRSVFRPAPVAGAVALVAPTAAYYASSALSGAASSGWMGGSFIPSLFTDADTYVDWWHTIDRAVPIGLVALALVAVVAARDRARTLLAAGLLGYLAAMVMVNYRAATHDYYHLPLLALVALALGVGADALASGLQRSSFAPPVRRAASALAVATLVLAGLALTTGTGAVEYPIGDGAAQVAANRRIGELTDHRGRVLGLTRAYGADLAIDGGVVATEYPAPGDVALMRARGLAVPTPAEVIADADAQWFAATNLTLYRELDDLRAELEAHHRFVAEGDGWVLWRLVAPSPPGG